MFAAYQKILDRNEVFIVELAGANKIITSPVCNMNSDRGVPFVPMVVVEGCIPDGDRNHYRPRLEMKTLDYLRSHPQTPSGLINSLLHN